MSLNPVCMERVASCASESALQFSLPPKPAETPTGRWRTLSPAAVVWLLGTLFMGIVLFAKLTNHWQTDLPRALYINLVPLAGRITHGGM